MNHQSTLNLVTQIYFLHKYDIKQGIFTTLTSCLYYITLFTTYGASTVKRASFSVSTEKMQTHKPAASNNQRQH